MKARAINIKPVGKLNDLEFTLTVDRNFQNLQKLNDMAQLLSKGKELSVDIKQHRKRRSLDANAYAWTLCDKIAQAIGNTKEYVYQEAIKSVGIFEIVPIRKDAVEQWMMAWNGRGIGWQSEILEESKLDGYVNTINYYGSSIYDSKAFTRLLDEIILEAKELGIETMTPDEQRKLINLTFKEG